MKSFKLDSSRNIRVPTQKWFAGYIVTGLIYIFAQNFNKTSYDSIIIVVVAILCGVFYHRLKHKISLKDESSRIIGTFLLLEVIAGLLVGILTSLI